MQNIYCQGTYIVALGRAIICVSYHNMHIFSYKLLGGSPFRGQHYGLHPVRSVCLCLCQEVHCHLY